MSDELKGLIENFHELLDQEVEGKERNDYLQKCQELSNQIQQEIQRCIKKGEERNIMRLMKCYSTENRRLQEMQNNQEIIYEEDTALLNNVDVQIFEDDVQQRKQRLENVHKNMSNVKGLYTRIAEIVNSQVEQMFQVEENYNYTEEKTQKASQELMKAQQSQKSKFAYRIVVICILILFVGLMFLR